MQFDLEQIFVCCAKITKKKKKKQIHEVLQFHFIKIQLNLTYKKVI